jgi:hypothetical protein
MPVSLELQYKVIVEWICDVRHEESTKNFDLLTWIWEWNPYRVELGYLVMKGAEYFASRLNRYRNTWVQL